MEVARSASTTSIQDLSIKGLTLDSREVEPGFLFAAAPGLKVQGTEFIPQAIQAGATVILAPTDYTPPADLADKVAFIYSDNVNYELSRLASEFYPKQPQNIGAITGSIGKSSTIRFTYDLLEACGEKACSLGSLGPQPDGGFLERFMTTAHAPTNHKFLDSFADRGFTHLAFEVTSHGLTQDRVSHVNFTAAAFNNFSEDHLDYHGTMDAYFDAKMLLFKKFMPKGAKVAINKKDASFDKVRAVCEENGLDVIGFGSQDSDVYLKNETTWIAFGMEYTVILPKLFPFQFDNLMCAAGLALAMGIPAETIAPNLGKIKPVPGRMELVTTFKNGAEVFVDYAYAGPPLKLALELARERTDKKVSCVFGCGGDKAPERRKDMGEVAQKLADHVYVVDNEPRTEDPAAIRAEILGHCAKAEDCGTRPAGIEKAMRELQAGDILMVCGKGHETTIDYNGELVPHLDSETIRNIYKKMSEEGLG